MGFFSLFKLDLLEFCEFKRVGIPSRVDMEHLITAIQRSVVFFIC